MNQNPAPQGGQTNPNSPIITTNPQQCGENVVIQQAPTMTQGNKYPHFYNRLCAGLGITQIVIGVLAILMNTVTYRYQTGFYNMYHGIWGGIFIMITGALGTAAGPTKNKLLIATFMIMSILGVSFTIPFMLSISARNITFRADEYDSNQREIGIAMESIILILSVIEFVICIISAVVCCHAVWGCKCVGNQNEQQANIDYNAILSDVISTIQI